MNSLFQNKFMLIYYASLLAIFILWPGVDYQPPMALRLLFVAAVFIPAYSKDAAIVPILATFFSGLCVYGFPFSFMPTNSYIYAIVVLIGFLITHKSPTNNAVPKSYFLFLILTLIVNLLWSGTIESIVYSLLILAMTYRKYDFNNPNITKSMTLAYVLISIILSIKFLFFSSLYEEEVYRDSGFERSGWMDANYFGCAIGFGVIVSLIELIYGKTKSNWIRILYIGCIIISITAIIGNASRGAILATSASALFLLMFSRVKSIYKLLVVIFIVVMVYVVYALGYMDFLIYRMTMEDSLSDGSGRTGLWSLKFGLWLSDSNIFSYLFGIGLREGLILGVGATGCDGFHNDYVAMIVEYGIIGAILFLDILLHPIKNIKNNKVVVYSAFFYLLLCSFTLEPLADGYLLHFMFLFYIIALAKRAD